MASGVFLDRDGPPMAKEGRRNASTTTSNTMSNQIKFSVLKPLTYRGQRYAEGSSLMGTKTDGVVAALVRFGQLKPANPDVVIPPFSREEAVGGTAASVKLPEVVVPAVGGEAKTESLTGATLAPTSEKNGPRVRLSDPVPTEPLLSDTPLAPAKEQVAAVDAEDPADRT